MFRYELDLRKIEKSDLGLLMNLKMQYLEFHHRNAIINAADQEAWFDSLDMNVHQPKNIFMIGSHENQDVGFLGLTNINYIDRTAFVNCDILPEVRSKGMGTKLISSGLQFAREILNLRKICCEILATNQASIRMIQKNNFVHEGTRLQQVYKKGGYVDSLMFGLIIQS